MTSKKEVLKSLEEGSCARRAAFYAQSLQYLIYVISWQRCNSYLFIYFIPITSQKD